MSAPLQRQRGVALLAVSLLLIVVGALAYMMARQGAMAANGVNAQYDTERARYLAEAGINVARWRDQQVSCKKSDTLVKPSRIDSNGSYSAFIKDGDKTLDIDAIGSTTSGAQVALSRKKVIAHTNVSTVETLPNDKGDDTYISNYTIGPQRAMKYLELSQGGAHILLQFDLPGAWNNAIIVKAELTMALYQTNSLLPGQGVSVHRMLRSWNDGAATWLFAALLAPWTRDGADGDYSSGSVTSTTIGGIGNHVWDVTALVDGWANNNFPNYGLLLRADGPTAQARFGGFQSATGRPVLRVTYYKAC